MHPSWFVTVAWLGLATGGPPGRDDVTLKFADAPEAVRKAFQAETSGVKIESVTREKNEDDDTLYWAEVTLGGRAYSVGVLEDGTLRAVFR